jgi:hypothetical protein
MNTEATSMDRQMIEIYSDYLITRANAPSWQ